MIQYFILKILLGKDVVNMAVVYATLIIKGRKTIDDVPERIKEQVKQVLIDLDVPELAE
jgi:hypothetical protein